MGRFQKEDKADSWICQRCDEAQKSTLMVALGGGGKDNNLTNQSQNNVRNNNHNGKVFVPCPEFGAGWCQTKKGKKEAKVRGLGLG